MLEHLTKDTFSQHLNTIFRVHYESAKAVELELIEATAGKSTPRQEQFSIVFRGPHEPFLEQKIYQFEHNQLGAFDLFIVPIGQDQDGLYYQAVFNRFRKQV